MDLLTVHFYLGTGEQHVGGLDGDGRSMGASVRSVVNWRLLTGQVAVPVASSGYALLLGSKRPSRGSIIRFIRYGRTGRRETFENARERRIAAVWWGVQYKTLASFAKERQPWRGSR